MVGTLYRFQSLRNSQCEWWLVRQMGHFNFSRGDGQQSHNYATRVSSRSRQYYEKLLTATDHERRRFPMPASDTKSIPTNQAIARYHLDIQMPMFPTDQTPVQPECRVSGAGMLHAKEIRQTNIIVAPPGVVSDAKALPLTSLGQDSETPLSSGCLLGSTNSTIISLTTRQVETSP